MMSFLYVALGGAIGASARHGLSLTTVKLFGPSYPLGTLIANITGALLMGILVGWLALRGADQQGAIRLFAGVGLLGGFTTFSAFSLEAYGMYNNRMFWSLFVYVGSSVLLSILAIVIGLWISTAVFAE